MVDTVVEIEYSDIDIDFNEITTVIINGIKYNKSESSSEDSIQLKLSRFKEILEDSLRYRNLIKGGVREWSHYYDALSEAFDEPVEDYEDYSGFVDTAIKHLEDYDD